MWGTLPGGSCGGGGGGVGEGDFFYESKCLKVPAAEFVKSVKSTMDSIRNVNSTVARIASGVQNSGDFRLSTAVSDCQDLLDLSADELSWTVHGKGDNRSGTGRASEDLRTWLSAAMSNQETCIEGFDGTNGTVKNDVAGCVGQISSSVREILDNVLPAESRRKNSGKGKHSRHKSRKLGVMVSGGQDFPEWLSHDDRKLLQSAAGVVKPDAVVALDGSGNTRSIMAAVSAAPDSLSGKRYVIHVKKGVYTENVEIGKKKWNIMMIGDGIGATVITGKRSVVDGWTTYRSATFAVKGRGFIGRDLTIENTAGPQKHQAVALRSDSDLSVLYRCAITGYQDTLYAHAMRQFYRECHISGTVDFIFGDATAVFQNCQIQARKGLPGQKNTITAHGRKLSSEPTGFSIQFCQITGDPELTAAGKASETFLGRPWKPYSRTVVMQSFLSAVISPRGWLEWNGNFGLNTLFYGEYMNYGPGAGLGNRVNWTGYHIIKDYNQANEFTVAKFIGGNTWLPSTGIKYAAGLKEV
ncbi:unnamed protein product [Cuscuta campestris]|uniref:Pectinesterase n=1 Tax=Cuscuta campestris TaxID=132261 RepID=A0A484M4B7_9ASTE|nr:unnamed protein product [Cuscuta campestris]